MQTDTCNSRLSLGFAIFCARSKLVYDRVKLLLIIIRDRTITHIVMHITEPYSFQVYILCIYLVNFQQWVSALMKRF